MSVRRDKALSTAQQHVARGDLVAAAREYQAVVDAEPNDAQTWLLLADTLHRAGDVDAAVDRYVHAANLLLETGEVPNALQVYRQVLSIAPERYDVHMRTGQAFEHLRRYPEAVALYEKVAGVYLRSGNTREALLLYERVADLMPREIAKRLRLAELFSRERRFDEAVAHFQSGADFLRSAGRTQEYVRVAERLLYHRPVDAVIRELVRAYLELDEPRRALMKLNELLGRQNHDPEGLELLAETFVRLEKFDKACSVVLELVKHHRDNGPEAVQLCVTLLRRATSWAPNNQKVRQALDELAAQVPEPSAEADHGDGFDDIDDDFEELDEFDEVEDFEELVDDDEPPPPPAKPPPKRPRVPEPPPARTEDDAPGARRHSLTAEVISEGAQHSLDGDVDIDKQLEEVRVLLKYHLFEHALGHAELVLAAQPNNAQGLELAAEILAALGRNDEAADARARLAQQLIERDPSVAARQVELALALIPDHPLAIELSRRLSEISGVDIGIADVDDALPDRSDPLGALDLDDDLLGPIEASDSLIGRVDHTLAEDLGAGLDIPQPATTELEPPPPRDPLSALDLDELTLDGEDGGIDIRMADPSLHGELNRLAGNDDDFAISLDHEPEPELEPESDGFEDRFGLGDDADDDDDEQLDGHAPEPEPMVGRIEPDDARPDDARPDDAAGPDPDEASYNLPTDDDDDDDVHFGEDEPEPEPEPEPEEDWPDLSPELEELEFYIAQDLEDDALAAFNDLVELFPGHPKLIELAPRFGMTLAAPARELTPITDDDDEDDIDTSNLAGEVSGADLDVDAAAPLLDLEEEEDDDDFLAGIFDDAAPKQRKQREVAIQTTSVGDADASDHFDLGTAYREMGLYDKAFAEYELASNDPRWQAKALVMMGSLKNAMGDSHTALALFMRAVEAARTKDERCESNYELAMVQLRLGDVEEARAALERVEPGFRDRDEKLAEL